MSTSNNSRRDFLRWSGAGAISLGIPSAFWAAQDAKMAPAMVTPDQELQEIMAGNGRFSKGQTQNPRRDPTYFATLAHGQYPEAVIVTCADSRVAPEILFDCGVGDIFVVRVAGNVVEGAGVTVKGSIEYAIAELNVPLIFILGHSACGAVKAAKEHIDKKDSLPGAINGLVELIKPAVEQTRKVPGDPLQNAIIRNVQIGVERLQTLGPIVGPKVKDGKVKVVGGVYDLATGVVMMVPAQPLVAK
jgi:carbonic anhydrase